MTRTPAESFSVSKKYTKARTMTVTMVKIKKRIRHSINRNRFAELASSRSSTSSSTTASMISGKSSSSSSPSRCDAKSFPSDLVFPKSSVFQNGGPLPPSPPSPSPPPSTFDLRLLFLSPDDPDSDLELLPLFDCRLMAAAVLPVASLSGRS